MTSELRSAAQKINVLVGKYHRSERDPVVIQARRDHAVVSITGHIEKVLGRGVQLSGWQRDQLIALLQSHTLEADRPVISRRLA